MNECGYFTRYINNTQTKCLSNIANKQKFVDLLSYYLEQKKINCSIVEDDVMEIKMV